MRRQRGTVGALALVGLMGACSSAGDHAPTPPPADAAVDAPPALAPLPRLEGLPVLEDTNPDPRVVEVNLTIAEAEAELVAGHRTTVLAFNGRTPGPVLQARVGDRVIAHVRNELAEETTIHWHGLRIPDVQDGNPMVVPPIPAGGSHTYEFVVPDAGTYWYHPHANTIEQIERGLYGAIVVHEAEPPRFTTERVLVLDDVRLDASYQVARFATTGHDAVHGRAGNLLLTNGAAARATGAAPRGAVERWRVVNAAGSRTMTIGVEGASWRVVGTDGGLVPAPWTTERVTVAAGQRYDLEVTFDGEGEAARLVSDVLAAAPGGGTQVVARTVAEVRYEGETARVAPVYPAVQLPPLADTAAMHTIRLGATTTGGLRFTINGVAHDPAAHDHGARQRFAQGEPVRFTITNEIAPEHPFHLHGQFFQVLTRRGRPAEEPGLKDTVLLNANESVVIETRFENPGRWMYHCHIPEHAEAGMMAELEVTPR